ncbi:MAG: ABC transporter ATP-binding protein [Clostridiaceae bacterium]|nr:ABC transporter ATP-binding protein [Clostridiaceae bacterium]
MGSLMPKNKLVVENLSKQFGSNEVLQDISFSVEDGEFLSILGPSGCGKTTLLRILLGLEEAESGRIIKDGREITHLPPSQRKMGMVFQNYALFENMTVLGNVEYALKIQNGDRELARQTARRLLERVGLTGHLNKKPHTLSGGQQQRVALARTLAMNPDIILLDEPMSALDVETRLALRAEILSIQEEFGSTILYITHDQEEAFAMSDRIMVMDQGVIQQIDTPRRLMDHPANDYIRHFVIRNIQLKIDSLIRFAREEQ